MDELVHNVNHGLLDMRINAEVSLADCLEYPCLLLGVSSEPVTRDQILKIQDSEYMQIYKDDSSHTFGGYFGRGDNKRYFFGFSVHPGTDCKNEEEIIKMRVFARYRELRRLYHY